MLQKKVIVLAFFKKSPWLSLGIIVIFIGLFLALFSGSGSHDVVAPSKIQRPVVEGVPEAVDPRAVWSDEINTNLNALSQKIDESLSAQNKKLQEQLFEMKQELELLKTKELESMNQPIEKETLIRVIEDQQLVAKPKPVARLMHLQRVDKSIEKNPEDYVTSGSFARAVLLTGVIAETGTEASSEPQPILLRLVDHGIFSKGYETAQLKEAILIGSCHGKISSERAMCRLESVSLMSKDGNIVERNIEGWIIGEDGRPGIKGTVVDKASNIARMSVFNGILGGMASFFQNQASSSIYPISPIIGQTNALKGSDALKSGAASGVGNALQKLADYAIKRAEQMNPVIVIGSGREVDVVFKKGFLLEDEQSAQKKSSAANLLQQVEPVQQEVKNAAILSFDDLQNSSEGNF